MTEKEPIIINDDLFLNTVSCPLKLTHITDNQLKQRTSKLYFRQRNKLHTRDAIATRFENCRHTSNSAEAASIETGKWLKEETVAICGAVIQHENLLTRIPILVKNGDQLTIIQVHGKLRKRSESDVIRPTIKKRSILRYLLKAAYRLEVLNRRFPAFKIEIQFYFPNKHFKSSVDNLHLFHQQTYADDKAIQEQLSQLFTKAHATKAAEHIREEIPGNLSYKDFKNVSVRDAIRTMNMFIESSGTPIINRHASCKYCQFRLPGKNVSTGCWDQFFSNNQINHPEKHIFELIGHGNNAELENGTYYQEQAEPSRSFNSVEKLINQGSSTITILQRRNLQILQAKDLQVPNVWLKQGAKIVDELKYPLHFLDFEAATYAIPMKKESRPYTPVYFQFSCHTLRENGELIHTEWLDLQEGSKHPHKEFVRQLSKVPGIFEGTIMQYSPFEKQGVNRLIADFKRDQQSYQHELELLEKIRISASADYEHRFFDVSKIIRDYYFNEYLNDSLGLKHILKSVVQWEYFSEFTDFFEEEMIQTFLDFNNEDPGNRNNMDPYQNIQNSDFSISDGSDAMNAWLAAKNGLLPEEEEEIIPRILKKYCTLDSFALFVIFKHIKRFTGMVDDKDYIAFQHK